MLEPKTYLSDNNNNNNNKNAKDLLVNQLMSL